VVEHCLAKAGVAGSNPVSRSIFFSGRFFFTIYIKFVRFVEVILMALLP
jgi:hypothetical protein